MGGGGGGGGWSLNTNDFPSFRFQKMEGGREEGPLFARRQWGRDVFEFPTVPLREKRRRYILYFPFNLSETLVPFQFSSFPHLIR